MNNAAILIIDDEAQIRRLLEITLESNSFKVESAETAKDGLRIAANHPPDLIILDLVSPTLINSPVSNTRNLRCRSFIRATNSF